MLLLMILLLDLDLVHEDVVDVVQPAGVQGVDHPEGLEGVVVHEDDQQDQRLS